VAFVKRLEFGNYTLNFGEKKVMLDLFEEVVMPSFHEMKYVRSLKDKGDYFFLDTKLIKLDEVDGEPVLGVSGRIVKNTKLRRDQIFRADGGIIEDRSELETAPSSTFLLVLNNHRLILCKEVPGGPTIQNFQSTSQYCLRESHKLFVKNSVDAAKKLKEKNPSIERVTKIGFYNENPIPMLRITPLADSETLKDYVGRFGHIDKVTIKLMQTNREEIDNDDFWSDFGRRREELNSSAAKVEFTNTKEGLDGDEVYTQAKSASAMGNSEVKLKGYDDQGDSLSGSNDDFRLTVEVEDIPRETVKAAKHKYGQFRHLVQSGVIALPQVAIEVTIKIAELVRRL